jgi:hypothetical protein
MKATILAVKDFFTSARFENEYMITRIANTGPNASIIAAVPHNSPLSQKKIGTEEKSNNPQDTKIRIRLMKTVKTFIFILYSNWLTIQGLDVDTGSIRLSLPEN